MLELTLIGAYNYDADGFAPALELLASGALPLDELIEPDDVLLDGLLADDGAARGRRARRARSWSRPEVSDMSATVPTLNHVAITMDPAVLDDAGRADILDVLRRGVRLDRGRQHRRARQPAHPLHRRVRRSSSTCCRATEPPLQRRRRSTTSASRSRRSTELETIVARPRRARRRDDRVRIIDMHARTTHGPTHDYMLTSAYIGFVLPFMVELQHLERRERTGPAD